MTRTQRICLGLVIVLGFVIRSSDMYNPADFHTMSSWRESDYTEVTRSFYREGMNIFAPRVDWRGTTSGEVEMEFPAIPWLGALLYWVVGYHEQILRILSAVCSMLGLLAFVRLAQRFLPAPAAIFATALFACNGMLVGLSGSIQPESLQIMLCVVAMIFIVRWSETGSLRSFYAGCGIIAAAILAKAPSALLGLVVAYYVFRRVGWKAFVTPWVYIGAALALIPSLAWYAWAHHLYTTTGLSLGLSNETHFMSWVLFVHPIPWIRGNILAEYREVFTLWGILLALAALLQSWKRIEIAVIWFAAVVLFYVIIADTSGDDWATYYHSNSVPAACLLMGAGFSFLLSASDRVLFLKRRSWLHWALPSLVGGLTLMSLSTRAYHYAMVKQDQPALKQMYTCMKSFQNVVPELSRIVIRGGSKFDEHGHSVAYNESMAFTWMDRKGCNYPAEDFSCDAIQQFGKAGAGYWVAGPADQRVSSEMEKAKREFELVSSCDHYMLFRIEKPLSPAEIRAK